MSKNLLHKTKLDDFKNYLKSQNIKFRNVNLKWQVLQIRGLVRIKLTNAYIWNHQWLSVFDKESTEHYTVDKRLDYLVVNFLKQGDAK